MQLKSIITLLAVLFMLPLSIDAKKENNGGDGSTDRRYQYFFIEAMRQQSMGNYASAFELLTHAKDIDGNKPEVYYYLAMYLARMEKDSLALTSLEKAVSLAPKNETYQERLAQFYIGNGKFDKATEAYTRLCDEHSYRTDAMKILLQLYQQEKNYTKMLDVINRIEQVDGESEDLTLSKVRVYELMNKPKDAHKALKELADNHPYDINYQIMLGNWLLQNNKADEAYSIFTKALKEEANNPYAQSSLYDYYKQHGDSAKAADMMEKILVSTEQSIENKLQFVREAIKENEQHGGDSIKMLSLFNRMIAASPEETDIRELADGYELQMELPGYKKEEVRAALHKGYLTISAARSTEETVEGKYLRRERYTGSCQRSFYVGEYLRQEDIRASFQNGILTLFVPKEDKTKTEEKKYITIA